MLKTILSSYWFINGIILILQLPNLYCQINLGKYFCCKNIVLKLASYIYILKKLIILIVKKILQYACKTFKYIYDFVICEYMFMCFAICLVVLNDFIVI